MKTRRILAASTAALLSFGAVAVVASADPTTVDVEYDSDWTEIIAEASGTAGVSYKISKNDAKKLEGLTIGVEAKAVADADAVKALDGDMKTKLATAVAAAVNNQDSDSNPDPLAAIFDISVSPEDDEDYTAREDFKLAAPIQINITGLDFAADKVYHIEGGKLVEIKADKLTKKTESGATTYGIQFTSKSFSPFVVAKGAIKGATALDDEENPANDSDASAATSDDGATSPDTGIALAIAPVVLAAGAVAVVALKKKH